MLSPSLDKDFTYLLALSIFVNFRIPSLAREDLGSTRENLILFHASNKGADQPAHLCSLISLLVIHSLESTIAKLATCKNLRF